MPESHSQTEETPIDRAARAAAAAYGLDWNDLPDENPVENGEWDKRALREMIRAAFNAIREPSEAVLLAGEVHMDEIAPGAPVDLIWKDMIDAVLRERPYFITLGHIGGHPVRIRGKRSYTMPFGPPLTDHFATAEECIGRVRASYSSGGDDYTYQCSAVEDGILKFEPVTIANSVDR